jgi:methylated-DNA-[protein]-cysteine S-methyltransferase
MPHHGLAGAFVFPSELGWIALAWNGSRLSRMAFGHPSAVAAAAHLQVEADWLATDRRNLPPWVAELAQRLQSYAAGEEVAFDDIDVDLSHLTAFQQRVVRACRRIRRGRTKSYAELAAAAGSPGAARAVGNIMASNRVPIVVPCHRVVGSGGSLGGFSAPDGLGMKRRMLALEGAGIVRPRRKPRTQGKVGGRL